MSLNCLLGQLSPGPCTRSPECLFGELAFLRADCWELGSLSAPCPFCVYRAGYNLFSDEWPFKCHLDSEAVAQIFHKEHRDISFRIGSGARITSL